MKITGYFLFMLFFLNACTELYNADINNRQQFLVIDAFIGDSPGINYVKLSYSLPFDSVGTPQKISSAKVYVTDNLKVITPFTENTPGMYTPLNPSFTGVINKTYTLSVETPDKEIYVSYPQKLLPQVNPVKVSGGYGKKATLFENAYGQAQKREENVCEIYYDFKAIQEEVPRLRFTSSQIMEYIISKGIMQPVVFYCWYVYTDNSLRYTSEKYQTHSDEINNQIVSVTAPDSRITVRDMSLSTLTYTDSIINTSEYRRIIRINQYRLNPSSYAWYKGIESQSSSEGKIFDPLTSQLYGNLFCKSNPEKLVLGFFEVSPVTTSSWMVFREGPGTTITIKSAPNIYPPSGGFTLNKPPDFWIN
jgi:hypothetical protein